MYFDQCKYTELTFKTGLDFKLNLFSKYYCRICHKHYYGSVLLESGILNISLALYLLNSKGLKKQIYFCPDCHYAIYLSSDHKPLKSLSFQINNKS